jgi:sugar lactone lactonase YvrE
MRTRFLAVRAVFSKALQNDCVSKGRQLAVCILVSCLGLCSQASAQNGIITTVAGGGAAGPGDGGPATAASFSPPYGIAVDASGNFFIADFGEGRIRKVSAQGIITTVAGGGTVTPGDGGPATAASLSGASGVVVDASGNLFIAEGGNNRVRKVSTSGIITTVAGNGTHGFSGDAGPATAAALFFPYGVAVDASGNLFIADQGAQRIRKVSASGIISTVAGGGNGALGDGGPATSATLQSPWGVAVDASGNLYIADFLASRIRKVSASGIITTVAGNGAQSFSGDGGPATSASLNYPYGVAVDASGNLFVADYLNDRIRKVAASGIISTVAGNGVQGFSGDAESATAASLNHPIGVAVDASGDLFVADEGNQRIREVTQSSPVGVPVLASLSPSSATVGGAAFTLTVNGSGFVSGSAAQWNGAALTTTFVSATQLTAVVPASYLASARTVQIAVVNPAGSPSNALPFTINAPQINQPVPVLTSLTPSSAAAGGPAFSLTVNGSNFVSSSLVVWNGAFRTTTFVSGTQLTAAITAADIASPGTAQVAVISLALNPSQFGTSNALTFTTNPPQINLNPALAITTSGTGSGTVGSSPAGISCGPGCLSFAAGTVVTLTATPNAGSTFAGWSGPCSGTGGCTVTVNSNQAVSAAFDAVYVIRSPVSITSLSTLQANPLDTLIITGSGFDPANAAISVLLVSEAGNPSITIPAFAVTDTTVQIMMPPLPVTGTFGGDIVDLQVIQVDGGTFSTSNVYTGLSVGALPALPSGATTGDLTLYFLETALNVSSTLQGDATANGWTALAADLTQYNANLNTLIANVSFVKMNPGQTAAMTTGNGLTVALDQNALALSDQLIQAYVTHVASQIPSSFSTSLTRKKNRLGSSRAEQAQQPTPCPSVVGLELSSEIAAEACAGQQYMQTYAAQDGKLLQVFGTLYYGFGMAVLGGYASATAAIAGWSPDALLALQTAWGGAGSYVAAAGTASAPPSPCDVIATAGATVLDDAAKSGIPIFSTTLAYIQLDRDVSAVINPSAQQTPCPGPLLTASPANAPSGTTAINIYQTSNGVTTETMLAAPTTQQSEPTSIGNITMPPPPAQQYTLTITMPSGTGNGMVGPPSPPGTPCGTNCWSYTAGTMVTLTANPATGSTFAGWSGCSGTGMTCTATMNSTLSVTAIFILAAPGSETWIGSMTGTLCASGAPGSVAACDPRVGTWNFSYQISLTCPSSIVSALNAGGVACSGTASGGETVASQAPPPNMLSTPPTLLPSSVTLLPLPLTVVTPGEIQFAGFANMDCMQDPAGDPPMCRSFGWILDPTSVASGVISGTVAGYTSTTGSSFVLTRQ